MPRIKGQRDDIHVRVQRGLRDDTIDHMAINDTRCWLWKGAHNCEGRPVLKNSPSPHRVLYELHIRAQPGMEDYTMPADNYRGTVMHLIYPTSVTGRRNYATPLIRSTPCTADKSCINPYHHTWYGKKMQKDPDWHPKYDDISDLKNDAPPLPTTDDTPTPLDLVLEYLTADDPDANWRNQTFDYLKEELAMDLAGLITDDDLHTALTQAFNT